MLTHSLDLKIYVQIKTELQLWAWVWERESIRKDNLNKLVS